MGPARSQGSFLQCLLSRICFLYSLELESEATKVHLKAKNIFDPEYFLHVNNKGLQGIRQNKKGLIYLVNRTIVFERLGSFE